MNKILFPTDFSEPAQNAFRHALLLADQTKASIQILHVVYPEAEAMDVPVVVARATQYKVEAARELMTSFVDMGLTQMLGQLHNSPDIHSEVEIGIPIQVIRKIAETDEVDLIVMGTKGEHNSMETFLGTISAGVVSSAHCPVLVIPEEADQKSFKKIAYATDLRDADPYEIWQASQMLDAGEALWYCVHFYDKNEDNDALDKFENFFSDQFPGLQIQFHNLPGNDLEDDLEDFVEDYDLDLLIMYKPKRGFFDRLFHRSQTKKMVLNTEIPLLVVKPGD